MLASQEGARESLYRFYCGETNVFLSCGTEALGLEEFSVRWLQDALNEMFWLILPAIFSIFQKRAGFRGNAKRVTAHPVFCVFKTPKTINTCLPLCRPTHSCPQTETETFFFFFKWGLFFGSLKIFDHRNERYWRTATCHHWKCFIDIF